MFRLGIERKLKKTASEISRAREEVRVLDLQIVHFGDDVDETRLSAILSETSGAKRDQRSAERTVEALMKDRAVWKQRIEKLEQQQDKLLDQLNERAADGRGL